MANEKGCAYGTWEIVHKDKFGNIKSEEKGHNVMTKTGMAVRAALFGLGLSGTKFSYIALGTGTTPVTSDDTTLEAEITSGGGERASATVTQVTVTNLNDTAQFVKEFTFTDTFAVSECGLFNDSSDGVMASHKLLDAVKNVVPGDVLTVTVKITFS